MSTIYRYGNDFDRSVIFDKMSNLDDKIDEEKTKDFSNKRNDRIRELMYAKFIQGLRLNTGYNFF